MTTNVVIGIVRVKPFFWKPNIAKKLRFAKMTANQVNLTERGENVVISKKKSSPRICLISKRSSPRI